MDRKMKFELDSFFQSVEEKMDQLSAVEQRRKVEEENSEKEFTRICNTFIWPSLKMFAHYLKDVQGLESQIEPLGDNKHDKKYTQMTISGYHTRYDFNKKGDPFIVFFPIETENTCQILTVMVIPGKKVEAIRINYTDTNEDKINSIVKDFIINVFQ